MGKDLLGNKKAFIFSSEKVRKILSEQKPVDKNLLERVKCGIAKQDGQIIMGDDVDKYLELTGKEATIFDNGDILLHSKISASGLFEELIHFNQIKKLNGRKPTAIENAELEIEAKKKLLQNQKQYGITDYEIEVIKNGILDYENKIRRLKNER